MRHPPRTARWLARMLLPDRVSSWALADLDEEYRLEVRPLYGRRTASVWYWRQCASLVWQFGRERLGTARRRPTRPGRNRKGVKMLEKALLDVRFGLRSLLRRPGMTLAALATLALGIGASVAIFSLVSAVVLRPLPYPEPERLVVPATVDSSQGADRLSIAYPDFLDWKRAGDVFEKLALVQSLGGDLTTGGDPRTVRGRRVSEDFFSIFGAQPVKGRLFTPENFGPGPNQQIVLSEDLWRTRFGSREDILGQKIEISGNTVEVVGVLDGRQTWPPKTDFWISLRVSDPPPQAMARRDNFTFRAVGRLAPGVSLQEARAQVRGLAQRVARDLPDLRGRYSATVHRLYDWIVDETLKLGLYVLLGAVLFVLLIVCVNVANLLLARTAERIREMGVRMAMGAGRVRLVRQLLTESLILSGAGALAGLLVARFMIRFLLNFPRDVPRLENASIDWRVMVFALALALGTAIVFGLVPALKSSRGEIAQALQDAGRSAAAASSPRLRSWLTAAEVALSLALLIGAGLLLRSFAAIASSDPGLRMEDMLTVGIRLPSARYPESEQRQRLFEQAADRIAQLPGVQGTAAASTLPFQGGGTYVIRAHLEKGAPKPPEGPEFHALWNVVDGDFFSVTGIPLLAGRSFDSRDSAQGVPTCIISREMARRMFPGEDPLGKQIRSWRDEDKLREIVGVVGDVKLFGRADDLWPVVYVPYRQVVWPRLNGLLVHTEPGHSGLAESIRSQIWALDPKLPLSDVRTMEEISHESLAAQRFLLTLLGAFAAGAVLLAAMGIYGVLSYLSSLRTQEIGVRMAMGARRADILGLMLRQGLFLTGVGVAIGLALSLGISQLASSLLNEISPADPLTYAAGVALLAAIALLAGLAPALRAARIDPVLALRDE